MSQFAKIFLFVAFFTFSRGEKYTTKWDNINVDEILASDRLLGNYKKCLMDQGACTPEGQELKKNIPDALQTECMKCSEKQKINTEKVIDYLMEHKTAWWEELQQKYDPEGIYQRRKEERKKKSQESQRGSRESHEHDKEDDQKEEGEDEEENREKNEEDGDKKEEKRSGQRHSLVRGHAAKHRSD